MWRQRDNRGRAGDRGVTLLLFALLVTALLIITATVIDLGFVRQNRQADKSATDFAVTAGVQALDGGVGQIVPWNGICRAVAFLKVNGPEYAGLAPVDASGNSISDPCTVPPAASCVAAAPQRYFGTADGGRVRVIVQSPYSLQPGDSGFAEDGQEYVNDQGAGPCDHIAVIVQHRAEPAFGGVAGATGWTTTIRSVARVSRSPGGEVAPSMILLERFRCRVLTTSGTNATVVAGNELSGRAGTIHADSNASSGCAANSKIFDVDGSPSAPAIKALASSDGSISGSITSRSLVASDSAAQPQFTADTPNETCVQGDPTHCVGASPTSDPILPRGLVTRSIIDNRYLNRVRQARTDASTRFGWNIVQAAAQVPPYATYPCNHPGPFVGSRIFVECDGGAFAGGGKTFPNNSEIVIKGYITLSGTSPLDFGDSSVVYVQGRVGGNERAISLGSNNVLVQNLGGAADCAARYAQPGGSATRGMLIIGNGSLYGNGGTLRLCQTAVVMLDTKDSLCAVPGSPGQIHNENNCVGSVNTGGGIVIDWSAPNVNDTTNPSPEQLDAFEDLAFWTETRQNNSVQGGGGMRLAGIFFTPNADPFTIGGGGAINLTDAQFVSRSVRANGGGVLRLSPKAQNAATLPAVTGAGLIR